MLSWEREIGQTFEPPDWEEMLDNMFRNTRSHSIPKTAVKLHTRWYVTPVKLHSIYPVVSPRCFRGCAELGSLTHIFWSCTHLVPMWQKATSKTSTIAGRLITLTVQICLCFTPIPDIPAPCEKLIHTHFVAIHTHSIKLAHLNTLLVTSAARMEAIKLSRRIHHTLYYIIYYAYL